VHIAPTYVESGNGLTTLGLMYDIFSCISARGCFQETT
jgi:hypothetical protein